MYPNALSKSLGELFPRNAIAAIITEMPKSPNALGAFFPEEEIPGFHVKYGVYSGGRPMAPIVSVNSSAVLIQPSDHFVLTADPLVVKAGLPILPDDLIKLADPTDATKSYVDGLKMRYAAEIRSAVERRRFWAIAELLTKGQIYYVGGHQNPVRVFLSFDLLPSHKRSVLGTQVKEWGVDPDADPVSDLVTAAGLIDDDGGAPATHVMMNRATMLSAIASPKMRELLVVTSPNISEFDLISRFKAYVTGLGLTLVVVNESYAVGGANSKFVTDGRVAVFSLTGNDAGDPNEAFGQTIQTSSVDAPMGANGDFGTGYWSDLIESKDPVAFKVTGGATFLPVMRYPDRLVCLYVKAGNPGWDAPTL